MANFKKIHFIMASVAALVLIFLGIFFADKSTVFTDDAYLKADITQIRPKIIGYITQIYINDNQKVKMGDKIAKIDDQDYQLKVNNAQNFVDIAESKLAELENKLSIQELKINKAAFYKDAAKSDYDRSIKDAARARMLIKDRAISQKDLDKLVQIQNNSRNTFEISDSDYEIELLNRNLLFSEINQTKAQLEHYRINLALANIDLENTIIRAPVDGIVSKRNLQMGQLVSSNIALAYVVQNNFWVAANFKETQTGKIRKNNKVTFTIDSIPGKTFTGLVDSISPATGAEFSILPPENATGNFTKIVQRVPVKIAFNDDLSTPYLNSGLSCQVTIKLE
jgi:membrane fusion protein (multidrug efflux system)